MFQSSMHGTHYERVFTAKDDRVYVITAHKEKHDEHKKVGLKFWTEIESYEYKDGNFISQGVLWKSSKSFVDFEKFSGCPSLYSACLV